jgi:hypothetical protein
MTVLPDLPHYSIEVLVSAEVVSPIFPNERPMLPMHMLLLAALELRGTKFVVYDVTDQQNYEVLSAYVRDTGPHCPAVILYAAEASALCQTC